MRSVEEYMKANHLSRTKLALHLNCSASYVSQMLNGDTNVSLEKLCEVALAVGKVPIVKFEDLEIVLDRDAIQCERHGSFHLAGTMSGSAQAISSKTTYSVTQFKQRGPLEVHQ